MEWNYVNQPRMESDRFNSTNSKMVVISYSMMSLEATMKDIHEWQYAH